MRYENARDLLPDYLLRQVQKYISGKMVYIPAKAGKRKWGTVSGYREYIEERNQYIRCQFAQGSSVDALADEHHLSVETIRRIVYSRKETIKMMYEVTLSSAEEWAKHGMLEQWGHRYLLSDGHNKPFSDGLKLVDRIFLGPFEMPLSLFQRCTGPEDEGLKYQVHPDVWEWKVQKFMELTAEKRDLPPLIVHYLISEGKEEGEFELNDGNHRWEAYTRMGIENAAVIVWITDDYE